MTTRSTSSDSSLAILTPFARVAIDPGAKGINVSRVLRELERESMAASLSADSLGRFVEHALLEQGILRDFVHTNGQTRTSLAIVDETAHETTFLSYRGPEIDQRYVQPLESRLRRYISPGDWLVIAGSIPPSIEPATYARLIELGRELGAHTVLDAGAAACLTTGTQLCRRADVKRILPDVRVKQSRSAVAAGGDGGGKRQ